MIQYYTAIGRYELRTGSNGAKQPVLLNSSRSYEPSLCEMLLWSSLLWHIRDQQELEIVFANGSRSYISAMNILWHTIAPVWSTLDFCTLAAVIRPPMLCLS